MWLQSGSAIVSPTWPRSSDSTVQERARDLVSRTVAAAVCTSLSRGGRRRQGRSRPDETGKQGGLVWPQTGMDTAGQAGEWVVVEVPVETVQDLQKGPPG